MMDHSFIKITLWNMFSVSICATLVFAQDTSQTSSKTPAPRVTTAMVENLVTKLKTPISLKARDANLAEVISILSQRSQMNIVMGSTVKDVTITMDLRDTPLDEAINLVVRAAGLYYEIIGSSILIAEAAKLKDDVGQTGYVVNLQHANAKEVKDMLVDLTKNIQVDEGGNRLVCFTSPRVINEISNVVNAVDIPQLQVVMEVKLTEVNMSDLDRIGVDWTKLLSYNTFFTEGKEAAVGYGGATPEGRKTLPYTTAVRGMSLNSWQRQRLAFEVGVDMLVKRGKANLLADSKIATMNNREASLHIGEKIPYVISAVSPQGQLMKSVEKENTGVKLKLTPHVNDIEDITVTIAPEVSSIIGWRGENQDIPLVKTREAYSTIRVKNGQKIFLAGLLSEENSNDIIKVPLLGSIPFIGKLFQRRVDVKNKTNLIIEITPRIIK